MPEITPADATQAAEETQATKPKPRARRKPASEAPHSEHTQPAVEDPADLPAEAKPDDAVSAVPETAAATEPSLFRSSLSRVNLAIVAAVLIGGVFGAGSGFIVGVQASNISASSRAYSTAVEARQATAASDAADAAVTIRATTGEKTVTGAGVLVSPNGYIITSTTVADADSTGVTVVTGDGAIVLARVLGVDTVTGVSLLRVDGANLPFVDIATTAADAGDEVTVIGAGGITAIRHVSRTGHAVTLDANEDQAKTEWLPAVEIDQSEALTPGAGVFNTAGDLVAVALPAGTDADGQKITAYGVTAAAALNAAQRIARQDIHRGYLGVGVTDSTSWFLGARVVAVEPGTPAAAAKLRTGDVVTAFNREPVHTAADLNADVRATAPGQYASLTVLRDRKEQVVRVKVAELLTAADKELPKSGR